MLDESLIRMREHMAAFHLLYIVLHTVQYYYKLLYFCFMTPFLLHSNMF